MDSLISVFIVAFTSVFVIVNPLSGLFAFMSMTSGYPKKLRNHYARKSILLAAGLALFFAISGSIVLQIFNISIDALRIAGGLILLSVGFNMMTAKVDPLVSSNESPDTGNKDFWIFPVAIPLMCGPGTISTVIVLTGGRGFWEVIVVLIAIVIVYIISYGIFRSSEAISKRLSYTGMLVITRLLGLLLAAIAVGMIMKGLEGYILNLIETVLSFA